VEEPSAIVPLFDPCDVKPLPHWIDEVLEQPIVMEELFQDRPVAQFGIVIVFQAPVDAPTRNWFAAIAVTVLAPAPGTAAIWPQPELFSEL
jgi:hypothetical protein